jgi:hypothetical protein
MFEIPDRHSLFSISMACSSPIRSRSLRWIKTVPSSALSSKLTEQSALRGAVWIFRRRRSRTAGITDGPLRKTIKMPFDASHAHWLGNMRSMGKRGI